MYNKKKIECWPFFKQDPMLSSFGREKWITFHGAHVVGPVDYHHIHVFQLQSLQRTFDGLDDVLAGQSSLISSANQTQQESLLAKYYY